MLGNYSLNVSKLPNGMLIYRTANPHQTFTIEAITRIVRAKYSRTHFSLRT